MSKHVTLTLHFPEETVACDFSAVLTQVPRGHMDNPITEYFSVASGLVKKIVNTQHANDSEILGLLVLGVISSAEFYFRRILSELSRICPICTSHAETIQIPSGATDFYSGSGFSTLFSAFEHESLADSKRIASEIKRFASLQCNDSSSIKKALDDFEMLCELRHCLAHSRGFVGLKAMRALREKRRGPHKLRVTQSQALDFIKLSHNAVRAVNHYLSSEVLGRWIDGGLLTGTWRADKRRFETYWKLFVKAGEDAYSASLLKAYSLVRPTLIRRKQAASAAILQTALPST